MNGRVVVLISLTLAGAVTMSGCSLLRGTPDREDTFATEHGECTARWWLDPPTDDVPADTRAVAEAALASAEVTPESSQYWQNLLLDSQSDGAEIPEHRLEGQAYIEVVRAYVRERLDAGGYPDENRVIEVWSDLTCSS